MFGLLAGLHVLLLRGVLWLLKLPLKALWALVLSVVALLGEETRRWLGVVMAGLMILAVSWATLKVAANQQVALLLVMLMGLLWLRAVFFAAHLTAQNRVWKVRQRQSVRQLSADVSTLRGEVVEGMARRAWGTPVEGMWKDNRERRDREAAEAQVAAEQAGRQRTDAEEWERIVAKKRAEREHFAAAARARWEEART